MQQENIQLKQQVDELSAKVDELAQYINLLKNSSTIPLEIDQALNGRLQGIKARGTVSASTQSVSVPSTPTSITVPAQPSGALTVTYQGSIYNLLYA